MGRGGAGGSESPLLPLVGQLQRGVRGGGIGRYGQQCLPPVHDPIRFREEPMAPQIHAVAAVVDRLRDTPDLGVGLEYQRTDVRAL